MPTEETEEILTPLIYDAQHGCFGCGELNPIGLQMRFFTNSEHEAVCHVAVPERFQGPHGFVHGGVIASMLDEAMSKAIHAASLGASAGAPDCIAQGVLAQGVMAPGVMAMTRHLEIDYLRPVPLTTPVVIRAREARVEGRKHFCEASICDQNGQPLATAKALFIAIARQPEHKH